jgi:Na+-transporting methylmalonyl-CoA/oxaloacetate decarboxylase gamma subunit
MPARCTEAPGMNVTIAGVVVVLIVLVVAIAARRRRRG